MNSRIWDSPCGSLLGDEGKGRHGRSCLARERWGPKLFRLGEDGVGYSGFLPHKGELSFTFMVFVGNCEQ
jgi:hypothetical protein